MGNTQTGDVKTGKGTKTKGLRIIRGKRGKTEEIQQQFTGVVPSPEIVVEQNKNDVAQKSDLTASWCDIDKDKKEMSPQSCGDSSSDSVFTDPVTPVGFSTELNQCYHSEESFLSDVEVPDNVEGTFLHDLTLNSFKLNEHIRREKDWCAKLSKLGVSKTSQISLDTDPRDSFATDNIEMITKDCSSCEDYANVSSGSTRSDVDDDFVLRDSFTTETKTILTSEDNSMLSGYKRHMSEPGGDVTTPDGIVLKRVASLTLNVNEKGALESRVTRPKFVPEKLDFKLYEKFEGHMLVNWYLSEFTDDHHLASKCTNQELKLLAIQFCTYLLAAGVLRQIPDKDTPIYTIFKPDLMYFWTHSEVPVSIPETPGKLSTISWPPMSPDVYNTSNSNIDATSLKSPEVFSPTKLEVAVKEVELSVMQEEVRRLKQEVEKYKTLIEIQTLTANAVKDFSSPVEEKKMVICKNCDINLDNNDSDSSYVQTNLVECSDKETQIDFNANVKLSQLDTSVQNDDVLDVVDAATQLNRIVPMIGEAEITSLLSPPTKDSLLSSNEVVPPPPPPPPLPLLGSEIPAPRPPPPPPLPTLGSGVPLAPPPPPMTMGSQPPLPPLFDSGGPPPPPPPMGGPSPLPAPPIGGWNAQRSLMRKPTVTPPVPMKPLYWTRILVPTVPVVPVAASPDSSPTSAPLWTQIEEINLDNLSEFTNLFSRQVVSKKPKEKVVETKVKVEVAKLLDSKRSQNVGILAQSLHVDFQEIESAIYNFDTSVVSLEALQQIYEARATPAELDTIKNHLETVREIQLDKPEQFLYDLSKISNFAERISCFMFQAEFDDSISTVEHTLTNLKITCQFLITSPTLKDVFAIILTLGNYMNGGNLARGQADGFGLEILSKLRDVKSRNPQITLLHFVVQLCIKKIENPFQPNLPLPIPQPDDVARASAVNFDDLKIDLQRLQDQLRICHDRTQKVVDSSKPEHLEPFKEKMTLFLDTARRRLTSELENLEECQNLFVNTMKFYNFKVKNTDAMVTNEFFDLWWPFCKDFKDIWKKELIRLEKEKMQEIKRTEKERMSENVRMKKREDGLKAKIERLKIKPKIPK